MRRMSAAWWPIAQGTGAATLAWVIARYVLDHPEPFFAPIAAVIGLNAAVGERGLNALKLLQGVIVGILVGELMLLTVGSGWAAIGVASFIAMMIALALGGTRIVIAQAAVGAILTIAGGETEAGGQRLIDALVGVGVALVFTQVLFSPEPVRLLRRAESLALEGMADGLDQTASALERDDNELAEQALDSLRDLRDRLSELGRTRHASTRSARRSAKWRSQMSPALRESEDAGHLDLLGVSCLVLARIVLSVDQSQSRKFIPSVRGLANSLSDLAEAPGDKTTREGAATAALSASRLFEDETTSDPTLTAIDVAIKMVAVDIMVFAGADPDQAIDAVRRGQGDFDIPTPPSAPRTPFSR